MPTQDVQKFSLLEGRI